MKRVNDHIRKHLLRGIFSGELPGLEELRETEWSPIFAERMSNRLVMGRFRYGPFWESKNYDHIRGIRDDLKEYECTGNLECLVDAANEAMLEYSQPKHPNAHWDPKDDGPHTSEIKGK